MQAFLFWYLSPTNVGSVAKNCVSLTSLVSHPSSSDSFLTFPSPFPFQSDQMSHLVKIPGIVIAATPVRAKATRIAIQCRSCRNTISNIAVRPGLEGYALPRKCNT